MTCSGINTGAFLTRRRALFAKLETVAGTAETLASADTVIAREITVTPIEAETVERTFIRDYLGSFSELLSTRRASVTVACEFAGGGTGLNNPDDSTTPNGFDTLQNPNWYPLFRSCGFGRGEGYTAATSGGSGTYVWTPVSNLGDMCTCTILCRVDGIEHRLRGCLGTFTIEMAQGEIPVITFTMTGHYATPTTTPDPVTPATEIDLKAVRLFNDRSSGYIVGANNNIFSTLSADGTSASTVGALMPRISAFSLDIGNTVTYRETIGPEALGPDNFPETGQRIYITDRAASGSITTDATDPARANPWGLVGTGERKSLELQHGAEKIGENQPLESGIGLTLRMPNVTLGQPTYGDDASITTLEIPLRFEPGASGNDEVALIAK